MKVFVSGVFSILHPGHLRLLRFAKECGSRLIVAVYSDRLAGDSALVNEKIRLDGVRSISWVDEAFILDGPVNDELVRVQPEIVVKGKEHEFGKNPESEVLEQFGGKLIFSSGEASFSSLDALRKEFSDFDPKTIALPHDFLRRQKVELAQLLDLLGRFPTLAVCVIGDLIVDEYITCQPLGMSQEDPTIVVTPIDTTRFLGGAGIVAAHAAGLGARVQLLTVVGDDSERLFAAERLAAAGVTTQVLLDESRPTTLKQRFRSSGKSLLRVSRLHQGAISSALQNELLAGLDKVMDELDLLIFSDFNYGCLPQPLVDQITLLAKAKNVMTVADSQSSSQVGDISRFRGMNLITPTEHEARLSTRNREDGLVVLAEQLRRQSTAKNVFLKLGEEGLLVHAAADKDGTWKTDRIDALNSAPKDVAGAGDSLLVASALSLAAGGSIWEAACLGSLAAAVQVGRVGNTPIKTSELVRELAG